MDTEQLVNNPYEQMQKDAANDYQKKTSLTEKCTSVKNNVCENHFMMTRSHLDREMNKHLRQIHEDTSRLRYEIKLLDLNKRKHEVEFKKRLDPNRDFSYDDNQLTKTEKRLGVNIESYYLDKKLRYPVRGKMTGELIVTPLVAQARHSLKEQKNIRRLEKERERAVTAKSLSSSECFTSAVGHENRQRVRLASRSAPITTRSFSISRKPSGSRFPNIQSRLDGSGKTRGGRNSPPNHVKFAFENPVKILTQSDNQYGNFVRSQTFHGVRRRSQNTMDSTDDESDSGISEHVDLRAILFGKPEDNGPDRDNLSVKSHPTSFCNANTISQPPTPMIRRAGSNVPQQQTQEKLRKEAKQIQDKVVTFLNRLETDPLVKRKMDDEFSDDDLVEDPNTTIGYVIPKSKVKPEVVAPSPKPVEKEEEEEAEEQPVKVKPKEAWKLIRGHTESGSLHYTPADLVMQQLTGILLVGGKKGHVPMNSASRAMRHTATFKMRKVVEQLIEGRTRFQQHEVDELKRKMEGEESSSKLGEEGSEVPTVETVA